MAFPSRSLESLVNCVQYSEPPPRAWVHLEVEVVAYEARAESIYSGCRRTRGGRMCRIKLKEGRCWRCKKSCLEGAPCFRLKLWVSDGTTTCQAVAFQAASQILHIQAREFNDLLLADRHLSLLDSVLHRKYMMAFSINRGTSEWPPALVIELAQDLARRQQSHDMLDSSPPASPSQTGRLLLDPPVGRRLFHDMLNSTPPRPASPSGRLLLNPATPTDRSIVIGDDENDIVQDFASRAPHSTGDDEAS